MTMNDNLGGDMTLDAFTELLDRHGPEPSQWPGEVRAAAIAFLQTSDAAQAAVKEAIMLDELLDLAPVGEVHSALKARILQTAPGASVGFGDAQTVPGSLAGWLGGLVTLGWVRPAAFLTASLAAGFYVGLSTTVPVETYEDSDLFAYVFELPTTWDAGADAWSMGEAQ